RQPASELTRSINLMCYLLRGITYNQLYRDPILRDTTGMPEYKHLFDKLIENASALPGDLQVDADGNEYDVSDAFTHAQNGAFIKCKAIIDGYDDNANPAVILGELFWVPRNYRPRPSPLEAARNGIVD